MPIHASADEWHYLVPADILQARDTKYVWRKYENAQRK